MLEVKHLETLLKENPYPGRGIVLGNSQDGQYGVIAYFIMGRSSNSRNRIFTEEEDGIKTEAYDVSKLEDPSLIIYHPVRYVKDMWVVTNGDQTDTIRDALLEGKTFFDALQTRTFEPDAPNYTPRISGILKPDGEYELAILKASDAQGTKAQRQLFTYPKEEGLGHFLHTYQRDGDPLVSFEGEPRLVSIEGDIETFTNTLWDSLNTDNKISLYVNFINLQTKESTVIMKNKYQEEK